MGDSKIRILFNIMIHIIHYKRQALYTYKNSIKINSKGK